MQGMYCLLERCIAISSGVMATWIQSLTFVPNKSRRTWASERSLSILGTGAPYTGLRLAPNYTAHTQLSWESWIAVTYDSVIVNPTVPLLITDVCSTLINDLTEPAGDSCWTSTEDTILIHVTLAFAFTRIWVTRGHQRLTMYTCVRRGTATCDASGRDTTQSFVLTWLALTVINT